MTKKEVEIFNSMKENAYNNYFELRNTEEELIKGLANYEDMLGKSLAVVMEYRELAKALEI